MLEHQEPSTEGGQIRRQGLRADTSVDLRNRTQVRQRDRVHSGWEHPFRESRILMSLLSSNGSFCDAPMQSTLR